MPLTMQPTLGYRSNASGYGGVDLTRPWAEQNRLAWLNLLGRIRPEQRARAEATLQAVNRDALVDMSLEVSDPRERPVAPVRSRRVDPLTGVLVVVLLTGSALLACSLPARRAARVDPIQALRTE